MVVKKKRKRERYWLPWSSYISGNRRVWVVVQDQQTPDRMLMKEKMTDLTEKPKKETYNNTKKKKKRKLQ